MGSLPASILGLPIEEFSVECTYLHDGDGFLIDQLTGPSIKTYRR